MNPCFEMEAMMNQLDQVATEFLVQFPRGGIFLMPSEMGSGKTTLCKSLIEKLGYEFEGSPTFSIANHYRAMNKPTALHLDLYRVNNVLELEEMGFAEMLTDSDYVFIEWPEKALTFLNSNHYSITITEKNYNSRHYSIFSKEFN